MQFIRSLDGSVSQFISARKTKETTINKHRKKSTQQHTTLNPTAGLLLKLSRVGPGWETRFCWKWGWRASRRHLV